MLKSGMNQILLDDVETYAWEAGSLKEELKHTAGKLRNASFPSGELKVSYYWFRKRNK